MGVDENKVTKPMMTVGQAETLNMGEGTPPYMSLEMYAEPQNASYPTDFWSLGVSMFELVTGIFPFQVQAKAHNYLSWQSVNGNLDLNAHSVLDKVGGNIRLGSDDNLAKVISKALEKPVKDRYASGVSWQPSGNSFNP